MADYFRVLHLYFLKGTDKAYFTRAKDVQKELQQLTKSSPLYEKLYLRFYVAYTRDQEKITPNVQRLMDAVEEQKETLPKELSDSFLTKSRRYIQLTNVLSFNLRAYSLFLLVLLGLTALYFPFIILGLEALNLYMVAQYEKIAGNIYQQYFTQGAERS